MFCVNSSSGWNCIYFCQVPFSEKKILWTSVKFSIYIFFFKNCKLLLQKKIFIFILCVQCFSWRYICVPYVFLVAEKTRREYQIPRNWRYSHGGAENGTRVLWKSSMFPLLKPSLLSRSNTATFMSYYFTCCYYRMTPILWVLFCFTLGHTFLGLLFWSSLMVTKIKTEALGKPGGYSTTEP